MTISYSDWLSTDAAYRCVLVEAEVAADGVETVLRLSNTGYATPAGVYYDACLTGSVTFDEQLSLDGTPRIGQGDIGIVNTDGERDAWLNYVWANRPVRVWLGDARWPLEQFELVIDGVAEDLDSANAGVLNIKLRDKLQRLNTPVTEVTLGGTTENKDRLLPIALGECHNVTPLLVDPANHEFQFHAGAAEMLIEARDAGAPITVTATPATGRFRHTASPTSDGQITASVQGDARGGVYRNTVASIVRLLVTEYGQASRRLTAAEIHPDLAAFDAAHPQPVGMYLADRANVVQVCQEIAASLGAQVVTTRLGLLRLVQLQLPVPDTTRVITAAEMDAASLRIARRPPVVGAVKLAYCRNWTVQTSLKTGLPETSKDNFSREWLHVTASDPAVLAAYRRDEEPPAETTYLLREDDATAEATRRLALWSVQRHVFGFSGGPALMDLVLGQGVILRHRRFGLAAGRPGIVIGLRTDFARGTVDVEVLV